MSSEVLLECSTEISGCAGAKRPPGGGCLELATGDGKPKRLRPWLESLLNRGDIAGLYWIDPEKTMFRIPWKHHGKQDWTPDDSRIFMVRINRRAI